MRQSHDASFLNWQGGGQPSFIYEAQSSCVVSGTDIRRWVAYCFVESYFDIGDEARETVTAYDEGSKHGGISVDPCTFGRFRLDANIKDPREWFLVVFQCRLRQIKCEWRQVVWRVKQSVRDYEEVLVRVQPEGRHKVHCYDTRFSYLAYLLRGRTILSGANIIHSCTYIAASRSIDVLDRHTLATSRNLGVIALPEKPKSKAMKFSSRSSGLRRRGN
jgi:hypothetical protein